MRSIASLLVVPILAAAAAACTAATDLKLGDCYDGGARGTVTNVQTKVCSEPHDTEVFGVPVYPGARDAPFPGDAALTEFATERCPVLFEEYVGIPLEQSALSSGYLTPTDASWKEGDRVVVCVLAAAEGKLTGSMKDARR